MNRKQYGFNSQWKYFCKVSVLPTTLIEVQVFVPKRQGNYSGYQMSWAGNPNIKILSCNPTRDGRKDIWTFLLHPTVIVGYSFESLWEAEACFADISSWLVREINLRPHMKTLTQNIDVIIH